jgi:putative transposase
MRAPFTQIYIHLVWSTWDRAPIITQGLRDRLYAAMAKRCNEMNCNLLAIGGIEDHVHLLVQLHPAVSISDLVKDVKGASSHLMNHEINPGGDFRWQGAYGAFSIREIEVDTVKTYILNQADHHANNTISADFEQNEVTR